MRKKRSIILGIIQLFIAIGAIPAGILMILEPDGASIGMSTEILASAPFNTFLIPGLVLFFVLGLLNLIAAFLSFKKNKYAGILAFLLGIMLLIWLFVQIYFIGFTFFLQLVFFVVGIVEIFLGYKSYKRIN